MSVGNRLRGERPNILFTLCEVVAQVFDCWDAKLYLPRRGIYTRARGVQQSISRIIRRILNLKSSLEKVTES